MPAKILTALGSLIMVAFGVWHFFVPGAWNWYTYILPDATELAVAVRAINACFSLCLVLIGIMNLLFTLTNQSRFVLLVSLSLSSILWAVRVILQITYPQGSMNTWLQYGMLGAFVFVFLCFAVSIILVIKNKAVTI